MNKKIIQLNNKPHATSTSDFIGDNCSNCFYGKFSITDEQGACHCNPPMPLVIPQQDRLTGGLSMNISSFFPVIKRDTWCGAHEGTEEFENTDDTAA